MLTLKIAKIVLFTDDELKLGVVVAEGHPHHIL